MKNTLFFLALGVLSIVSYAQADDYCDYWACTRVAFQCPPGPGYLKLTAVNNQGNKLSKLWSINSKQYCDAQKAILDTTRSEIRTQKLIAICNETLPVGGVKSAYLTLYSIDQFANIYFQSHTFYQNAPEECLKVASGINQ